MNKRETNTPLNKNLADARKNKLDEFYTQIEDIEEEMQYYKDYFKDKIIYCNCDNPKYSNFWKYFKTNFDTLGIKKLISTYYNGENIAKQEKNKVYRTELEKKDGIFITSKKELQGNGDFRSKECLDILEKSDIVVTNPPFSLFIYFVQIVIQKGKKLLVVGNINGTTNNDTAKLIFENKLWLGINNGTRYFEVPKEKEYIREVKFKIDKKTGIWYRGLGNICWYTNLEHNKYNEFIELKEKYSKDKYNKYDNYDAIEVSRVADIPIDYTEEKIVDKEEIEKIKNCGFVIEELGRASKEEIENTKKEKQKVLKEQYNLFNICRVDEDSRDIEEKELFKIKILNPVMGVPITFLNKYNPKQFELLGNQRACKPDSIKIIYAGKYDDVEKDLELYVNGKNVYQRIFIRRRI